MIYRFEHPLAMDLLGRLCGQDEVAKMRQPSGWIKMYYAEVDHDGKEKREQIKKRTDLKFISNKCQHDNLLMTQQAENTITER